MRFKNLLKALMINYIVQPLFKLKLVALQVGGRTTPCCLLLLLYPIRMRVGCSLNRF